MITAVSLGPASGPPQDGGSPASRGLRQHTQGGRGRGIGEESSGPQSQPQGHPEPLPLAPLTGSSPQPGAGWGVSALRSVGRLSLALMQECGFFYDSKSRRLGPSQTCCRSLPDKPMGPRAPHLWALMPPRPEGRTKWRAAGNLGERASWLHGTEVAAPALHMETQWLGCRLGSHLRASLHLPARLPAGACRWEGHWPPASCPRAAALHTHSPGRGSSSHSSQA